MGKKQRYWRVTKWNGMDNYECLECPFATLSEEQIRLHVLGVHGVGAEPPAPPPPKPRLDRFGVPVEETTQEGGE